MYKQEKQSPGTIIRTARKKKGMTLTGLVLKIAEKFSELKINEPISEATLSRIENGKKIPDDRLAEIIAKILNIPPQDLIEACNLARQEEESSRIHQRKKHTEEKIYKEMWKYSHPTDYKGKVWIQITPQEQNRHIPHYYSVRCGPWEYRNRLFFNGNEFLALWHMKEDNRQPMLVFFTITPPSYVEFGQGESSCLITINMNFRWKRVEPFPFDLLWKHVLFYMIEAMTLGHVQPRWIFSGNDRNEKRGEK